ncbi:MAG: hypothetical protein WA941_11485 [Nitrososphaeraceae archaeon]
MLKYSERVILFNLVRMYNSIRTTNQKTDYYNMFLGSIKSPYTKKVYTNALKLYLEYMDVKNANNLINQELIKSPAKIQEIENQLIDYISYLQKEKELSYATVHTRLSAVFHFYTINRVNLNKTYVSKFFQQKKKVMKDVAYTREQIRQILSTCNVRQKVVILLLTSTGMRVGALHTLKIRDLKCIELPSTRQHLYKITVHDLEPEEYYTFCTIECAIAIDEYLAYRERFGEKLNPEAPLIREEFDRNDLGEVRKPKHIAYGSMMFMIDAIMLQSGIRVRQAKEIGQSFKALLKPIKMCYGFRKFTTTQMEQADMKYEAREYLLAHKTSRGLDNNYLRLSVEDRLKEYLKAIDYLTINEENRLRKQVAEQEHTIQVQMAEKDKQIKHLTEHMAAMEEDQRTIMELLQDGGVELKKKLEEEEN